MGSRGDADDNAVADTFFATLPASNLESGDSATAIGKRQGLLLLDDEKQVGPDRNILALCRCPRSIA